jgi:hypothetical protein
MKGEKVCPRPGSNQRHADFQSAALPTELPGHSIGNRRGTWLPWVEDNDKRSSLIRGIKVVLRLKMPSRGTQKSLSGPR